MAYLLDTDIVIYWLTNRFPQVQTRIDAVDPGDICLSAITVAELYFGAENSGNPRQNRDLVDELVAWVTVIDFDAAAGVEFGRIKANLRRAGQPLADSDLFIAATAISHNLTLVTNNLRHFERIALLHLENWIEQA